MYAVRYVVWDVSMCGRVYLPCNGGCLYLESSVFRPLGVISLCGLIQLRLCFCAKVHLLQALCA